MQVLDFRFCNFSGRERVWIKNRLPIRRQSDAPSGPVVFVDERTYKQTDQGGYGHSHSFRRSLETALFVEVEPNRQGSIFSHVPKFIMPCTMGQKKLQR